MADFKTHIGASTLVGIGYGVVGYHLDLPLTTCMLSSGLCAIAGMLPDLDSDNGVPLRETIGFLAAAIPMLMIDRFQRLGMNTESMVLAGMLVYLVIRFCFVEIFKHLTVHRGMWHSIPAAISCGLATFIICSGPDLVIRYYKSIAVVLGFFVHLILDEIWSIQVQRGRVRVKKSFGTALKFFGRNALANFSTYAKLILFMMLALGDPMLMNAYFPESQQALPAKTRRWLEDFVDSSQHSLLRR